SGAASPASRNAATSTATASSSISLRFAARPALAGIVAATPGLLLLRVGLRAVALLPLGEDARAILRRPGEVLLHDAGVHVGRQVGEGLGVAGHGDHRALRAVEAVRLLGDAPLHELRRRV